MQKIITCFLLLAAGLLQGKAQLAISSPAASAGAKGELRVMTYNIRYQNKIDSSNNWENRRDHVAALIKYHQPDLIGMQEAMSGQINDLQQRLPDYAWYGKARMEGPGSVEYNPVFYRKSRFALLDSGTFWYSTTPDRPFSKSWDAYYPRIASWCRFKDLHTGKEFFYFNTHFDHRGVVAREKSAGLLVNRIKAIAAGHPAMVMGDFNSTENTPVYKILTEGSGLYDSRIISQSPHYGPEITAAGFWVCSNKGVRIDYIFVNKPVLVLQHATLTDHLNGAYFSDHLPVLAEIRIQ